MILGPIPTVVFVGVDTPELVLELFMKSVAKALAEVAVDALDEENDLSTDVE